MALERFNVTGGLAAGQKMAGQGGLASFMKTLSDKMEMRNLMQMQIGQQVGLQQALQQVDPEKRFNAMLYTRLANQLGGMGGRDTSTQGITFSQPPQNQNYLNQTGQFGVVTSPTGTPSSEVSGGNLNDMLDMMLFKKVTGMEPLSYVQSRALAEETGKNQAPPSLATKTRMGLEEQQTTEAKQNIATGNVKAKGIVPKVGAFFAGRPSGTELPKHKTSARGAFGMFQTGTLHIDKYGQQAYIYPDGTIEEVTQ